MEEHVDSVLINLARREITLFSNEGDEKVLNCNAYDEFMAIFKIITNRVDEEQIFYTKPLVAA